MLGFHNAAVSLRPNSANAESSGAKMVVRSADLVVATHFAESWHRLEKLLNSGVAARRSYRRVVWFVVVAAPHVVTSRTSRAQA